MDANFWTAVGSAATAIAVAVAAFQIWLARKQEKTAFEDGLVKEYRDLLSQFPRDVLLQETDADSSAENLPAFFRYFDLCNEQVFLRQKNRVRLDTWKEWVGGIRANLSRPGFRAAWELVKGKTNSFAELRCLETCLSDPRSKEWIRALKVIEGDMARRAQLRTSDGVVQIENVPVGAASNIGIARDTGVDE